MTNGVVLTSIELLVVITGIFSLKRLLIMVSRSGRKKKLLKARQAK